MIQATINLNNLQLVDTPDGMRIDLLVPYSGSEIKSAPHWSAASFLRLFSDMGLPYLPKCLRITPCRDKSAIKTTFLVSEVKNVQYLIPLSDYFKTRYQVPLRTSAALMEQLINLLLLCVRRDVWIPFEAQQFAIDTRKERFVVIDWANTALCHAYTISESRQRLANIASIVLELINIQVSDDGIVADRNGIPLKSDTALSDREKDYLLWLLQLTTQPSKLVGNSPAEMTSQVKQTLAELSFAAWQIEQGWTLDNSFFTFPKKGEPRPQRSNIAATYKPLTIPSFLQGTEYKNDSSNTGAAVVKRQNKRQFVEVAAFMFEKRY